MAAEEVAVLPYGRRGATGDAGEYGEDEDNDDTHISSDVPVPSSRPFGRKVLMGGGGGASASSVDAGDNDGIGIRRSSSADSEDSHSNNNDAPMDRRAWHKRLSVKQRASIRASLRQSVRGLNVPHGISRRNTEESKEAISLLEEEDAPSPKRPSTTAAAAAAASTATPTRPSLSAPGQLVRQQSWFMDLVNQGMSSQDLAEFFGDQALASPSEGEGGGGGAVANGSFPAGGASAGRSGLVNGGSDSNDVMLLEQTAILAHSEARQRLVERLGYDPWEQKAKDSVNGPMNPPSVEQGPSEQQPSQGPQQAERDAEQSLHVLHPPMTIYNSTAWSTMEERRIAVQNRLRVLAPLPSTPKDLFSWSAPKEWMQQKHVVGHRSSASSLSETPHAPDPVSAALLLEGGDLYVGQAVQTTRNKPPAGYIIVRCLGCQQLLSVSFLATLVRCCRCNTVSPASSSRK